MTKRASRAVRPAVSQAAFVLHSYDWSETSLILDLFTREGGRIAVAAKGAKRPHSQLRPVLLPFQRLNVSLGRPPAGDEVAEVQTLRQAEWAGGGPMLSGAALFSGFYLNELLMKLLARQDPHPLLFDAYAATLPTLARGGDAEEAGLRAFELRLLGALGVLPDLSQVTQTAQALQPDRGHALRPEQGVTALPAGDHSGLAAGDLIHLQAALLHGSQAALQAACAAVWPALKPQLRGLLHYHLGSPQLRTRQVMLDVQRLASNPSLDR
jgi:DNA repair protein RecO (recombination protein O)